MAITSTTVKFGLYDLTINEHGEYTCNDALQVYSNLDDFQSGDDSRVDKNPTYEPDFWLLDGALQLQSSHVGITSLEMSDSIGDFSVPIVLTITLDGPFTASGLAIHFSSVTNDFAVDMNVKYYNVSDVLISDVTYVNTKFDFSSALSVSNFKKIVVTFYSTNKPYRYLRIFAIDYGKIIYFGSNEIKTATVVEQIDPSGLTLPSNTFEMEVLSLNSGFSITDPSGDYSQLKERQPFDVYERFNDENIYMGRFYLQEWKNITQKIMSFYCVDAIGLFSDIPFLGNISPYYNPLNSTIMLHRLTGYYFDVEYGINNTNNPAAGLLESSNIRTALQQICFAGKAYATCSRSSMINIRKALLPNEFSAPDKIISQSSVGIDQKLELNPIVDGVNVTGYNYFGNEIVLPIDERTIYKEYLQPGTYLVKFDRTYYNVPAWILDSSSFINCIGIPDYGLDNGHEYADYSQVWVRFTVPVAATVEIHANFSHLEVKRVESVLDPLLSPSKTPKILDVEGVKIIYSGNSLQVANHLYNYYRQTFLHTGKLFDENVKIGQCIQLDTSYGRTILGVLEYAEYDLTGGFSVKTKIKGELLP